MLTPPTPPDWPQAWADALSDQALKQQSSASIFQRAKAYVSDGSLTILEEDLFPEPALIARVQGTDTYNTEIWIEADALTGQCDCPHAEEGWFCKHQVALALWWRRALQGRGLPVDIAAQKKDQAASKRASTLQKKRDDLQAFLLAQPAQALAEQLMALADQDKAIASHLQHWRTLSQSQGDERNLKAMITELLAPGKGFLGLREGRAYLSQAEAVLPILDQAIQTDAAMGLSLCTHALKRGWAALERADDSNGSIGNFCLDIGQCWVAALQACGPQPASYGDTYFKLCEEDPFGSFDTPAAEEAMGPAAVGRYEQLLAKLWRQVKDKHKALPPSRRFSYDSDLPSLYGLEARYVDWLTRQGRIDDALAVLRDDLSEPMNYNRVIELLEAHERFREALATAEAACKAFPDDALLLRARLRCYERDGWTAEAFKLRYQQFMVMPTVDRYLALMAAGQADKQDQTQLRARVMADLQQQEALQQAKHKFNSPDVSMRVAIEMHEGLLDAALVLVQGPSRCQIDLLRQLALRLPPKQYPQAATLLLHVFDAQMPRAQTPYIKELALVREICERLPEPQRQQWLGELRATHRNRRNFIQGLPS
jgi:hypothetical protein